MLDVTISWTTDLVHNVVGALGPIPKPNEGAEPPGMDKFQTLLGWARWGALFCCVAGFLIIGARMGIQHKRGEGGGHMGSLAIASAAVIVVTSAFLFVDTLVT
jgi:hypothetical protein